MTKPEKIAALTWELLILLARHCMHIYLIAKVSTSSLAMYILQAEYQVHGACTWYSVKAPAAYVGQVHRFHSTTS